MTIHVRLFAIVREQAGMDHVALDLPESATVGDAREKLAVQLPALAPLLARAAFAVNRAYVPLSASLNEKDEVAVIPPVSGG